MGEKWIIWSSEVFQSSWNISGIQQAKAQFLDFFMKASKRGNGKIVRH